MPTKSEVLEDVKKIIGKIANFPADQIHDDYTLTDPSLSMDSTQLSSLTIALNKYIGQHNSDAKITPAQVKKSGLTVKSLAGIVYELIYPTT